MKNLPIRYTLMFAVAVFVVITLGLSAMSLVMLVRSNDSIDLVHRAETQVILINDVYKNSARTRAGFALAYAALAKSGQVEPWVFKNIDTTYGRMLTQMQDFNKTPAALSDSEAIRSELTDASKALAEHLEQAIRLLQAGDAENYAQLNVQKIDKAGARFSAALEKYQSSTQERINLTVQQRAAEFHTVLWVMALALVLAGVVTAALAYMLKNVILKPLDYAVAQLDLVSQGDLRSDIEIHSSNEIGRLLSALVKMQKSLRSTVSRVRESSLSMDTSTTEIAAGNNDLSARTEQQASALQQTAASMEELSSTVKQNADNARQANQLAQNASSVAVKGGGVMAEVVDTMKGINDSSKRISDIISVIDGIAFQTNILALNAAVESARAGEQGRGFAVVASEVRSLAGRSADAAREIKRLITVSVERVEQGTALVDRAGETMTEVVNSIRRVADIMGEISAASSEQSQGVQQVGEAVTQLDHATQQNAALVEEMAAAAMSLKSQAGGLVEAVSVFRLRGSEPSR